MRLRKTAALWMAVVLGVSLLPGCQGASQDTVEIETATAGAESSSATEDQTLLVGSGEMEQLFLPLFATAEGDQTVVDLTQECLLTLARDGSVVENAVEGTTLSYNGTDYTYTGLADLSIAYDSASNVTTYTVSLRDGVTFSDGTAMTADDLIFTFYVLCDASYDGPYTVSQQGILGLEAYQKNNSAAAEITVSQAEISAALENPSEELRNAIIEQIIRPVLEEERTWCEANWQQYVDRGYGNSAEEFFVTLYTSTLDSSYSIEGKSFDDIVNDTVNLYGMDYPHLATNYQGDPSYFDSQVRDITYNLLLNQKMQAAGGTEVSSIQGIQKVDSSTVTLSVSGYDAQKIYDLFDVPVLSLAYYGDAASYNYEEGQYGFPRGDLSSVKAKSAEPMGAGPYRFVEYANGVAYLEANPSYYKGAPSIPYVQVQTVEEEIRVASVTQGKVDAASASLTASSLPEDLETMETAEAILSGVSYYSYVGINGAAVKVGDDPDSEASQYLRRALATILGAGRSAFCDLYLGQAGTVLQYPALDGSWTALQEGEEGYREAYSVGADGSALYTADMDLTGRTEAAISAAREYLQLAGFTYDEATGTFTGAPEGAKLTYQVLIPSYFSGDNQMTALVNHANAMLNRLGMGLETVLLDNDSDFNSRLASGTHELWCAERVVQEDPDLYSAYHSGNGQNAYGAHENLDSLIEEAEQLNDRDTRKDLYQQCYDTILNLGLEVPCFERLQGTFLNTTKLDAASIGGDYTSSYNWMKEIHLLQMLPEQ